MHDAGVRCVSVSASHGRICATLRQFANLSGDSWRHVLQRLLQIRRVHKVRPKLRDHLRDPRLHVKDRRSVLAIVSPAVGTHSKRVLACAVAGRQVRADIAGSFLMSY